MSQFFAEAIDTLDAEVFSGDSLESLENRELLSEHLSRWLRKLHNDYSLPPSGYITVEGEGHDETFGFASSIDGLVNDHINDRIVECQTNEIEVPVMHIVPFVLVR